MEPSALSLGLPADTDITTPSEFLTVVYSPISNLVQLRTERLLSVTPTSFEISLEEGTSKEVILTFQTDRKFQYQLSASITGSSAVDADESCVSQAARQNGAHQSRNHK